MCGSSGGQCGDTADSTPGPKGDGAPSTLSQLFEGASSLAVSAPGHY